MSQSGYAYAGTRNMKVVHIVFRRESGLLPDLVQSAAPGDETRAKIISNHIRLMSNTLDHHHQAEDEVLWPLLLARAPKEVDPVVHLAEGHHQRLDTLLHRVEMPLPPGPAGLPTTTATPSPRLCGNWTWSSSSTWAWRSDSCSRLSNGTSSRPNGR